MPSTPITKRQPRDGCIFQSQRLPQETFSSSGWLCANPMLVLTVAPGPTPWGCAGYVASSSGPQSFPKMFICHGIHLPGFSKHTSWAILNSKASLLFFVAIQACGVRRLLPCPSHTRIFWCRVAHFFFRNEIFHYMMIVYWVLQGRIPARQALRLGNN